MRQVILHGILLIKINIVIKDFVNEVENYKSLYSPYYYNIKLKI